MNKIRTRFAPSPTGYLHVGGVRTALFAWLTARQAHGQFILRIEDTDKAREISGAEKHILESLSWLGIDWDEGTDIGGPYAPYRQSERLDTYLTWAKKLITEGKAYADPYSQAKLESFRQKAESEKRPFLFREHRPENPPQWDGSQPLRLKSDPKSYKWTDLVMGDLSSGPEVIDDFILIKSDGFPTYNFGHIIDDYLMKVTHIIRGQEFISSMSKFLSLYEALGIKPPLFAHLPHVMAMDGKKKLGKRDGAKDILDYAREGYLPEAMMNFLATLGWNDGTEQEIFNQTELIEKFSLERVQRGGARFDEQRLLWMNGYYIRGLDNNALFERSANYWPSSAANHSKEYKIQVLGLVKGRLKHLGELPGLTEFFFAEPEPNLDLIRNNKPLQVIKKEELVSLLTATIDKLQPSDFTLEDLTAKLNDLLAITDQPPNILFSLIRIATTWASFSPALAESLSVLGKERTIKRLKTTTIAVSQI